MDGLPRYKAPRKKEGQPKIALDDYLFERKLQEVYDKKAPSNDAPAILKAAFKKLVSTKKALKKVRTKKQVAVPDVPKVKKAQLIDAPQVPVKRFKKTAVAAEVKVKKNKRLLPLEKLRNTKKPKLVVAVLAVGLLGVVGVLAVTTGPGGTEKPSGPEVAGAVSQQKPDFETLTPKNQDKPVKFDPTKKVASFEDFIDGSRVVVSQQQLAEKDIVDPAFLSRTATAFNLKTEITTKKGSAYTGINIEKNVQFAMFVYKDFLFFIQGDSTFKNQQVVDYIDGLQ